MLPATVTATSWPSSTAMTVAGRGAPPPRRPCVPWPARALLPAGRLPPSGPWSRRPRPRPRPPAGVACDGDGPPRHGTSALDVRPAPALRMRRPGAHRKIRVAHRGRECRGRAAQLSRHLADISRMNGPKPPLWSLCSPGQPRPSSVSACRGLIHVGKLLTRRAKAAAARYWRSLGIPRAHVGPATGRRPSRVNIGRRREGATRRSDRGCPGTARGATATSAMWKAR